jgi:hypothetical protein
MHRTFILLLIFFAPASSFYTTAEEFIRDPYSRKEFPKSLFLLCDEKKHMLVLTGVATRAKYDLKIYSIAHYMEPPTKKENAQVTFQNIFSVDSIKLFMMQWIHSVEALRIRDVFLESFHSIALPEELVAVQKEIDQFLALYDQDAKANDVHLLKWLPGGTIELEINGVRKGTVNSPNFCHTLWSIWMGSKSVVDRNKFIQYIVKD